MAEEVLREAIALGADRGILLTDRRMAGGDTSATSYTLARAIEKTCAGFDLVLCGFSTSDSETAQVGPQLAEELGIPGVAYVDEIAVAGPDGPDAAYRRQFPRNAGDGPPRADHRDDRRLRPAARAPGRAPGGLLRGPDRDLRRGGARSRPGADRGEGVGHPDPQRLLADGEEGKHRPDRDAQSGSWSSSSSGSTTRSAGRSVRT